MSLTLDLIGLVFVVWIAVTMNRQLEFSGFKRETFTPQRGVTGMFSINPHAVGTNFWVHISSNNFPEKILQPRILGMSPMPTLGNKYGPYKMGHLCK